MLRSVGRAVSDPAGCRNQPSTGAPSMLGKCSGTTVGSASSAAGRGDVRGRAGGPTPCVRREGGGGRGPAAVRGGGGNTGAPGAGGGAGAPRGSQPPRPGGARGGAGVSGGH